MQVEKRKIKKRLAEINEAISEIKRISGFSDKDFWARKENIAAVKYYLMLAIESAGGICVHIAAKQLKQGVSVFGECFEVLGKEGIIKKDLALRLKKMARFRNMLIHQYWEVNDKMVLRYCRKDLKDLSDFVKVINRKL